MRATSTLRTAFPDASAAGDPFATPPSSRDHERIGETPTSGPPARRPGLHALRWAAHRRARRAARRCQWDRATSYAHITLTYSVPSTADGAKVMLLFGGHIAREHRSRGWGAGVGAGSISGGPYHVRITAADGASVGNRDNQIMSERDPRAGEHRDHTRSRSAATDVRLHRDRRASRARSRSLPRAAAAGASPSRTSPPGRTRVTESAPPVGLGLPSLSLRRRGQRSTTVSRQTANIDLDPARPSRARTRTRSAASIVVEKQTNPGRRSAALHLLAELRRRTSSSPDGQQNDVGAAGARHLLRSSESVPTGWDADGRRACGDGSSPSSDRPSAGETVTCTFTNTKRAHLVVVKHVVNDNGGSAVASAWSMHVKQGASDIGGSPFAARRAGMSSEVTPGTYNVSESGGPAGTSCRTRATATRRATSPSAPARRDLRPHERRLGAAADGDQARRERQRRHRRRVGVDDAGQEGREHGRVVRGRGGPRYDEVPRRGLVQGRRSQAARPGMS